MARKWPQSREYEAEHQLDAKRLGWWKWKLNIEAHYVVLVEAETSEPKSKATPIEITCDSGHLVRVLPAFDDDTLLRVLRILERSI